MFVHSSGALRAARVRMRHCERQRSNPFFRYAAMWIASLALAMTVAEAMGCLKFESDFVARRPGAV
jgi:hypothetical protein